MSTREDWNTDSMLSIVLRLMNTLCTIATEVLLVRHYRLSVELLKAKQILRPSGNSLRWSDVP